MKIAFITFLFKTNLTKFSPASPILPLYPLFPSIHTCVIIQSEQLELHLVLVVVLRAALVGRLLGDHDDVVEEEHVALLCLDAVVLSEVQQALADELAVSLKYQCNLLPLPHLKLSFLLSLLKKVKRNKIYSG
jgi:hypothetical protein